MHKNEITLNKNKETLIHSELGGGEADQNKLAGGGRTEQTLTEQNQLVWIIAVTETTERNENKPFKKICFYFPPTGKYTHKVYLAVFHLADK